MKRIFSALLCISLLLCGCGSTDAQPSATQTVPTTQAPTTEAPTTEAPTTAATTEATVPETTVAATEPPVLYRHPLTGQWLEEPFTVRPVAVSTNNYSPAQPLLGVSHADIIYEHITEGGGVQTRMLAIYTDLNFEEQLGTVRSARTYSVELASNFNAPFVHCGGSTYANKKISQLDYPSFDQFYLSKYFYRDPDRLSQGYSKDHTMVTEGTMLLEGLKAEGFDMTAPEDAYYGFDFADEVTLEGDSAKTITIQFYQSSGKRTIMTYDESDGMYYGLQKWSGKQRAIADGNTTAEVPFRNILILNTKVTYADNGSNTLMDLLGEGTGYFACGGEYVEITWHRESLEVPFTYTLADGSPIAMAEGKTYIAIRPIRSPDVIFE